MTLNLSLLYFVWNEEYCQTSPNKNKSPKLWHVTSILVCCIFVAVPAIRAIPSVTTRPISSSPNPNNNHDRVFSSPSCNACIFLFYKQKIEIKKSEKKLGQCGRCWQSLEPNQLLSCYLLGFCPNNVFLSFNDNLKCQFHFPLYLWQYHTGMAQGLKIWLGK